MFWLTLFLIFLVWVVFDFYSLKKPVVTAKADTERINSQEELVSTEIEDFSSGFSSKQMTYEEHLEVAYWAVMLDLDLGGISPTLLEKFKPLFLEAVMGGSKAASKLLISELSDIQWDCPAWRTLPKKYRDETPDEAASRIARIGSATILERAFRTDLHEMCAKYEIPVSEKTNKPQMIKALSEVLSETEMENIAAPIRERVLAAEQDKGKDDMALFVASRISNIAYNAHRYEQLSDPEFVSLRPFWKFVYVEFGEEPKTCKKFDGKILPIGDAKRQFPHLPCKRRHCHCRLVSVSSLSE